MKKVVSTTKTTGEGLESLLGESVILLCTNYFYTGVLVNVSSYCVLLKDPAIVYETGAWGASKWTDSQKLHVDYLYVQIAAIESFTKGK